LASNLFYQLADAALLSCRRELRHQAHAAPGIDSRPHLNLMDLRKCATPANGVLEWSSQESSPTPEEVK